MGETSEGLSDEQNEEVTEPSEEVSDEGNSEEEGDDIANEDPSDEDPVEEEPSEEEVVDPTITINGDDDDPTPSTTEYTVKDATAAGNKTGYETNIAEAGAKVAENAEFTFTVTPKENYQIDSVSAKIGDATDATVLKPTSTATDRTQTYKIEKVTGNVDITIVASTIKYTVDVDYVSAEVTYNSTSVADGKIEAGKDLVFTAEEKEGSKITEVSYKIGTGAKTALNPADDKKTYTITTDKITGNVQITIKSVKTYTVTFKGAGDTLENVTAITDIKIDNQPAKPADKFDKDSTGAWEVSVENGQKISFKVSTAESFRVQDISIDNSKTRAATAVAVTNGVYSFRVREDAKLVIETELDPAQCGAFVVNVLDISDSAEVTVKKANDEDDGITGFELGSTIVTRNEKVLLAIAPKDGYDLDNVKIDGTVTDPKTGATEPNPAEWEITLTKNKVVSVVVNTIPTPAENDGQIKVVIDKDAEHLSGLTVKADGTGEALTATGDVYTVPKDSRTVEIAVTAEDGYEPIYDNDELIKDCVRTTANGKETYSYTIFAKDLKDSNPDTITFTEMPVTYSIDFDDGNGAAELSASMNDEEIVDFDSIPKGATVAVRVTETSDSIPLKSVTYSVGTTTKTVKATKGVAAFTVKMTGHVSVTVDVDAPYKAVQLQDGTANQDIEAVNGVYNVSYEGIYKVGLTKGDVSVNKVADVKVFNGKTELTEGVKITDKGTDAPALQMSQDVAGKKLTVKLYVEDDYGDYIDTKADYTLQVAKVVSKITAPGTAKQATDTTKEYTVTTDGGEFAKLTVSVANANPATADAVIKGVPTYDAKAGKLTIVTGQTPGTADVVITDGNKTSTIKVTTTALISKTSAKPTVALKSATDVDLTLTVGSKNADFANIANGAVWYKVETTPKGTVDAKLKDTVDTQYVKRTNDSNEVTIQVGKNPTLGSGAAGEYNVKVSLVHVIDSTAITKDNIDANIVKWGSGETEEKAETAQVEKACKTLTPAWESNLKLKKGQATLTTGEGPVTIAIPQFSKTTTYKAIEADNVTDLTYADSTGGLDLDVNENGEIVATANVGETAVGKHTIQVVAAANKTSTSGGTGGDEEESTESLALIDDYTMYASRATIVVTVVQGIDELEVQLPSQSIYKATGKAATLKPTLKFNDGEKATQPKAKNVKWELVDSKEKALPSDSKISINAKNGTITVAKDYVLKSGADANKFKIKVSADNTTKKFVGVAGTDKDENGAIYSKVFTITNKGAEVKTVAIVKEKTTVGGGSGGDEEVAALADTEYEVIAVPTKNAAGKLVATPVSATEINGAKVAVLNTTEVAKDDVITVDKMLDNLDLTIKSSKKDVLVATNGSLTVNKPAKGVKLTATANDGSKNKAELLLDVDYDPMSDIDLALRISKAENPANVLVDPTTAISNDAEYNGAATNTFEATLMEKAASAAISDYAEVTGFKNYDVKVTNGTKVAQSGNTVKFTTAKETVTIVLKDPVAKKDIATYTLKNKDFVGSTGTKLKSVKVAGVLKQTGKNSEQNITVKVEAPSDEAFVGESGLKTGIKAQIDLDWSKMNAKNAADFMAFRSNLAEVEYEIDNFAYGKNNATWTGDFALEFKAGDTKAFKDTKQGSFPLKVTLLGSEIVDSNTVTKALTQAAATTVKVEKTKKFTFKPATSYTIGGKDGYAVLSGKSSIPVNELDLDFVGLLNMADKNGQENKFTANIELVDGKLKVKADAKAEDLVAAHLTGYLEYTAKAKTSYYNTDDQSGVVKITVKIKDNASSIKYTHEPTNISFKKDAEATVTVKVNSKDALVADTVKVVAAKVKTTKDSLEVKEVKTDGTFVLTLSEPVDFTKKKKVSADVYIVTSDNANKNEFVDGKGGDWNKYAAVVKVTLTVNSQLEIDSTLTEAIKTAVNGVIGTEADKVAIAIDSTWDTIGEKILEAANGAAGVSPDFEVVAAAEPLKSDTENNKVTISLIVQQKGLTTNSETITIEVTVTPSGSDA